MNLKAKCVTTGCPAFGIEKPVPVALILGLGAPNDRRNCELCGGLMQTMESIDVTPSSKTRKKDKAETYGKRA